MLATSYHNVNMPKRQTSFNPEWTKEHEFISKLSRDAFHGFCTLCRCEVYLFISIISRNVMFQALCQIICLFMYFYYFQKPEMLYFQALCTSGSSQRSVFETDITMSWINTNTVNKHFFSSSVTYRSTSRYIVDHIVWQWIEKAISELLYHDTIDMMDTIVL